MKIKMEIIIDFIKGFLTKRQFYYALVAATIAYSLVYFNVIYMSWLLLSLYIFLGINAVIILYRKLASVFLYINSKIKGCKAKKLQRERIDIAFVGMGVEYKNEALKIIKEATNIQNDVYRISSLLKNKNY